MKRSKDKLVIGWREIVALPELGIKEIKAKVDTGARSSSLHAFDLEYSKRGRKEYVTFKVHPLQRNSKKVIKSKAEVLEYRRIKSSNGQISKRPVIVTPITLLDQTWLIELTLANRDEMGFRMLMGRESFRGRMLVDANKSYYGKKSVKIVARKKRKK